MYRQLRLDKLLVGMVLLTFVAMSFQAMAQDPIEIYADSVDASPGEQNIAVPICANNIPEPPAEWYDGNGDFSDTGYQDWIADSQNPEPKEVAVFAIEFTIEFDPAILEAVMVDLDDDGNPDAPEVHLGDDVPENDLGDGSDWGLEANIQASGETSGWEEITVAMAGSEPLNPESVLDIAEIIFNVKDEASLPPDTECTEIHVRNLDGGFMGMINEGQFAAEPENYENPDQDPSDDVDNTDIGEVWIDEGGPGVESIKDITVTDVTPTGFSVVWSVSPEGSCSSASVNVFEGGTEVTSSVTIENESENHAPAMDNGVVKVKVSGLDPNTTYEFETVTNDSIIRPNPDLKVVTTETEQVVVNNDTLVCEIYQEDGTTPAEGTLLIAEIAEASYPVTGWVAAGFPSPFAGVNLNNLYSSSTHKNLELSGGEQIILKGFGAILGNDSKTITYSEQGGNNDVTNGTPLALKTISTVEIDLAVGLNIITYPVEVPNEYSAYDLLQDIGTESEVTKILSASGGSFPMCSWFLGNPSGDDFDIQSGRGYLVYMETAKTLTAEGIDIEDPVQVDLAVGLNIIGLPHLSVDKAAKAYDLLQDIGTESEVTKILSASGGSFPMCSWFLGSASGTNFDVTKTGGYLTYMETAKSYTPVDLPTSVLSAPAITTLSKPLLVAASAPTVNDIRVTDVTPTSFSVVWRSDQSSTCTLKVFSDENGTNEVTSSLTITSESATAHDKSSVAGDDIGVMKVKVDGLTPETTYYFQTSTTSQGTSDTTLSPSSAPFTSVTVEKEQSVVNNDILARKVFKADGTTNAEGALLVAEVAGADYPVTSWVGDGYPLPHAGVNLNNLYSSSTHQNLELSGGEDITYYAYGGILGNKLPEDTQTVPSETGGAQMVDPDISLPVELSSFTAVASDGAITIEWRTEAEINNLGFDIYKNQSRSGEFVKVNEAMIEGAGTVAIPHAYEFLDETVESGTNYFYYLEMVDYSGKRAKSHIIEVLYTITQRKIPEKFALLQNFPNPFNPETWIPYQLPKATDVKIYIYNIKGQEIRTLDIGHKDPGYYTNKQTAIHWDGRNNNNEKVASGIYFYKISAGDYRALKKLIILK